jgi:ELWxxDGT repeat protein
MAVDAAGNQGLWVTDGTTAGTHEIAVSGANSGGLSPTDLTPLLDGRKSDGMQPQSLAAMRCVVRGAKCSLGASWSVPPASPSRTGCAFSSRTTRTAITAPANSCPATCWTTLIEPRSSSPITTPFGYANESNSRRAGASFRTALRTDGTALRSTGRAYAP